MPRSSTSMRPAPASSTASTTPRHSSKAAAPSMSSSIGAEALSRITDQDDRATAVLFGDGAGAALVGPISRRTRHQPISNSATTRRSPICSTPSAPVAACDMAGQEVYRHAVARMTEAATAALASAGIEPAAASTTSSPTRRTPASSLRSPTRWTCHTSASPSTSSGPRTPRRHRSRSRSRRPSATAYSNLVACRHGRLRRRFRLGSRCRVVEGRGRPGRVIRRTNHSSSPKRLQGSSEWQT